MTEPAYLGPDQDSLDALVNAIRWIEALLTGAFGTSVAILAVAAIGLMLLAGRVPVKRGISTIVGCFILFSAAEIAQGLTTGARELGQPAEVAAVPVIEPAPAAAAAPPAAYDPYAGASVPYRPPADINMLPH